MRRARTWWVFSLLLTVLLAAGLYGLKLFVLLKTARPPVPTIATATPTLETGTISTFSLPIEIAVADLRSIVNAKAPQTFQAQFPVQVHGFDHEHVNVNLRRAAIDVSTGGDRLNFSIPISGTAQFEGQFKPIPIGHGQHVTKTFDVVARIKGSATVRLNPDWSLQVEPTVSIDVSRAHGDVMGIGIDVRGRVRDAFNEKAPGLAKELVAQALASIDVRAKVQELWQRLHANIRINNEPPAWVSLRPIELRYKPPEFNDPKAIRLAVALRARAQTYVEPAPPPVARAPLPAAVPDATLNDHFAVVVPVKASVNLLAAEIDRRLGGKTLSAGGVHMRVSGITVTGSGDQVVVGFNFVARDFFHCGSARGRVYATAKLICDEPVTHVGLTDVQYDVQSKNALIQLGDWVFKPRVLAEVEKAAHVDIREELDRARARANDLLDHARRPDHVALTLKAEKLGVERVTLRDGDLYVLVTAEGRSGLRIVP